MLRVIAENDSLARLARSLGDGIVSILGEPAHLRSADAILVGGEEAWERLRAWRMGGVRAGVVVYSQGPPPQDRGRLEPVVLLRGLSSDHLRNALAALDAGRPQGQLSLACGTADLDRQLLERADGQTVRLTGLECRLLSYLGARSGRSISRDELQLQVWDHRRPVATRAVDMAVSRLRKKIERDPGEPASLITVRNGGYRLLLTSPRIASTPRFEGPLCGREADVDALSRELGVRILVGPPGVGKSRLAWAAAQVRGGDPVYVDLAGVDSLAEAASRVAAAAVLPAPAEADPEEACRALLSSCAQLDRLVVLDHLDDVSRISAVLGSPPLGLTVLGTSRVSLDGLPERTVAPLDQESMAELLGALAERAGLDPPSLDRLIPWLDGLPLAAELAVGRLKAMDVRVLEHALADDPRVLAGGEGRHESLFDAVSEVVERLSPGAAELLADLSAVRGAITVTEAEAMLGRVIFDSWLELCRHNLLQRREAGHQLPHVVREVARATHVGRADVARRLHAEWMAQRARGWLSLLVGTRDARDFDALCRFRGDIQQALDVAITEAQGEWIAPLLTGLDLVLGVYGTHAERLDLVERVCALETEARPLALYLRGVIRYTRDRRAALSDFQVVARGTDELAARAGLQVGRMLAFLEGPEASQEALDNVEVSGRSMALALRAEAMRQVVRDQLGETDAAASQARLSVLMEELVLEEALHDAVYVGLDVGKRMRVTRSGDEETLLRRLASWVARLPDPRLQGHVLLRLGHVQGKTGSRLPDLFAEAEALFQAAEPARVWQVKHVLAQLHTERGELGEARALWQAYDAWSARHESVLGQIDAQLWLAAIGCDAGDLQAARVAAERAVVLAEARDLHHYAAFGYLWSGTAELLVGEVDTALSILDHIDVDVLSPVGRASFWSRREVAARMQGNDAALDALTRLCSEQAELAEVIEAGRAGDAARLRALRTVPGVDLRVHVACWLLVC